MKRLVSVVVALVCGAAFAAEPYDKRLEFLESTGTQWIDTGLKLHYKRSRAQVNFRVLEVPSETAAICGVTAQKDDPAGYTTGPTPRASFVVRIERSSASSYRILPSFTGGEGGGYQWPNAASGDFACNWDVENTWRLKAGSGTNIYALINGSLTGGHYSNYRDEISEFNYYIGTANNAGEGLFVPEGSMAKLHWYGAKFWTDDELVGDFIPVLKDGVAGFYDRVTERFFPSQGADPWVAPIEKEWIGGGAANDLSDAANWKNGDKPSTVQDVAVFPAGCTVETSLNGCCEFSKPLGGIRLAGADTQLALTGGLTAANRMNGSIGGLGSLTFAGEASNATVLNLYCTMQNFCGYVGIQNVYTFAYSTYALGSDTDSETVVKLEGGSQRLSWSGGAFCQMNRSNIRVVQQGQFLFSGGTTFFNGAMTFDGETVSLHGNGGGDARFQGKLEGNASGANTFSPYSLKRAEFSGEEKDLHLTQLIPDGTDENVIACRIHSEPRIHNETPNWGASTKVEGAAGCGQNMANIRLSAERTLRFEYANALDEEVFVQVGYAKPVSDQKVNVVDLGGYDQRMGTFSIWASAFDPATVWNPNLVLKSDRPATLTIYGQLRDNGADHVFPGRVRGATSVKLDSKDEVMQYAWNWTAGKPGAIKFNCPGSDTTGGLAVNRGTMEILPTATFSNLSSVVVSGEGVMKIGTSAVGHANPGFTVAIKDSTATLELAEGVSNVCYTCEIPGGEFMHTGVYSGTEQEGVTYCEHLSGSGKLEVKVYGKPWAGWPEAGTAESVYIVQGSEVSITDDDVEKVQALSLVECGNGVTIDCRLSEKSIDFLPKFVGGVKICYWGKGSNDTVVISGDNSGLVAPGGWFLSNCTAKVCHRYGLGSSVTAPAEVYSVKDADWSVVNFDGADVTTNDVAIQFVNAAWLYHTDPDVEFVQNAPVTASGLDTRYNWRFRLKHRLTLASGLSEINSIQMFNYADEPCVLTVGENATLKCSGNFGTGVYVINGTYIGDLRIEQSVQQIVIGRDNPIVSSFAFLYDSSQSSFSFDLNGHDLTLTEIHGNEYPHETWSRQQIIPFHSDQPAVFSITGRLDSAKSKTQCAARFTGAAGVRIASGDLQTNVFGKGECRTTGSLVMDSGKLVLERGFTWRGAAVELNGGELTVDATTAPEVFGPASGKDRSKTVLVANGGTLTLNSSAVTDETPVCCVQIGTGTYLAPGAYVAGSAKAPSWLKGTGTLRVLRGYPPGGGVLLLVR